MINVSLDEMKETIEVGFTKDEIAEYFDISLGKVDYYAQDYNLKIRKRRSKKSEEIIELATTKQFSDKIRTMADIGRLPRIDVTRENIRQIIKKEHIDFKKIKSKAKAKRKKYLTDLTTYILNESYERSREESWPIIATLDFSYSDKKRISSENVFNMFTAYHAAEDEGSKISLEVLGAIGNIHPMSALRLLRRVGKEAMYGDLTEYYNRGKTLK